MKAARPGMQEYQIEALIEQIFRKRGAAGPAYTSIVGAVRMRRCFIHQ